MTSPHLGVRVPRAERRSATAPLTIAVSPRIYAALLDGQRTLKLPRAEIIRRLLTEGLAAIETDRWERLRRPEDTDRNRVNYRRPRRHQGLA